MIHGYRMDCYRLIVNRFFCQEDDSHTVMSKGSVPCIYCYICVIQFVCLYCRHELNDHVDTVQYDLEGLRDILQNSQYNLDPEFLLGVGYTKH